MGVRGMVRRVRGMYMGWSAGCTWCTRDGPQDVRGVRGMVRGMYTGVRGLIFIPRTFPRTPRTVRGIYGSCPRSYYWLMAYVNSTIYV